MPIDPREYYYNRFRSQFQDWIRKTNAHKHPGEGVYIPIQNLRPEYLGHLLKDDYMLFHCALACTVLIDQVMYTHFKNDYQEFQKMTLYPKVEYGISNINVDPWDITHPEIGLTILERFIEFFVADLKEFFERHAFTEATWSALKSAMLADVAVIGGPRGEIMKRVLEKN